MIDLEALHDVVPTLLADPDWAAPTPCDGWTVAGLVRHLVAGERAFTIALGGTAYDLAAINDEVVALADGDLRPAYAEAAAGIRAALVDAPELVRSPLGDVPPAVVAEIRALEAVAHAWDLAVALDLRLPTYDVGLEPLVGAAHRLRAALERTRPGNTAFATAYDVADDAPVLDRLLATLGRRG